MADANGNSNWAYPSTDTTPRKADVKEMPPVTSQCIYDENCGDMGSQSYPK